MATIVFEVTLTTQDSPLGPNDPADQAIKLKAWLDAGFSAHLSVQGNNYRAFLTGTKIELVSVKR